MAINPRLTDRKSTTFNGENAPAKSKKAGIGKGQSAALARVGNTPKGKRNVAKTFTDEQLGFVDDIEVRKADGTVGTLGELDQKQAAKQAAKQATKPAPKPATKPAPKPSAASQKALTSAEKIRLRAEQTLAEAKAIKDKAKADAAQLKKDARAKAVAQKKADVAAKKAERQAAAEKKAADREAAKQERAAAKLRAKGETGDPIVDAAFHAAVDEAKALALRPVPTSILDLSGLAIPGVQLLPNGLVLPENLPIGQWTALTNLLYGFQNASQFAVGDALVYGDVRFASQVQIVADNLGIEKGSVRNLKYVASAWPLAERVAGASFAHHYEATALYKSSPAAARNLLETAVYEVRPASWIRQQVAELRGPDTKVADRKAASDKLALQTDEEWAEETADLSQGELEHAVNDALAVLVDRLNTYDVVPSPLVRRVVAGLQSQVAALKAEVDLWRDRAVTAQKLLGTRDEAAAAVASYDPQATEAEPEIDLSFLGEQVSDEALDEVFGEGFEDEEES